MLQCIILFPANAKSLKINLDQNIRNTSFDEEKNNELVHEYYTLPQDQ